MPNRNSQQVWEIQQKSACFQEKCDNEANNKISTSLKTVSKMRELVFFEVGIFSLIS